MTIIGLYRIIIASMFEMNSNIECRVYQKVIEFSITLVFKFVSKKIPLIIADMDSNNLFHPFIEIF